MFQRKNLKKLEEELFERNKLKSFLLFFLFLLAIADIHAENYYKLDSTLADAQNLNYNLELESAKRLLAVYQSENPSNCASYYLLHFNAFLQAFISEEEEDYSNYRKVKDKALRHFSNLPDTSRYKRFLQSEVYFHSAAIKTKHNELYSAALDVSRVLKLVEENHILFPSFLPNNKSRGLLKVYLSTVPDSYLWAVRMLGVEGDIKEGLHLLSELAEHCNKDTEISGVAKEAAYLHAFSLYQVAKKPREAWVKVFKYTKDYETNALSAFFRANLAMKLNKSFTAISIIQSLESRLSECEFLFLDYMLGVLKLNQQSDEAITHLNRYFYRFKGRSFKQSCLQKISWHYVLRGNTLKATESQKGILSLPESIMEVDKQAQEYAKKPLPNKELLVVRLLCDNGEYDKAQVKLSSINHRELRLKENKVEYSYRYGQVSEKLGNMSAAIKFYEACTLLAAESKEYYGAYASIYLGDYYLSENQGENALKFYKRALSFHRNKEYRESIEHRASIGIKLAERLDN